MLFDFREFYSIHLWKPSSFISQGPYATENCVSFFVVAFYFKDSTSTINQIFINC